MEHFDFNRHSISDRPNRLEDVLEYFLRTEAVLWSISNSLDTESSADSLVEEIFETRELAAHSINQWQPDSLIELVQQMSLWVLQRYPDKSCIPENEWDQIILNAYFQLAAFIGIEPVREE